MSLVILGNEADFDKIVNQGVTLVDFYADWCGPCKMLAPVLEDLASATDATILKVDVGQYQALASQYGVSSIPAIYVLKDGEVVNQTVGFKTKDMLLDMINQAK